MPYGVPTSINLLESAIKEPENLLEKPSQPPLDIPLGPLSYLNKPEIPILIVRTLAIMANGALLSIFGLTLSNMVKTFYEPRNEL